MKAILEFDLPEEDREHLVAVHIFSENTLTNSRGYYAHSDNWELCEPQQNARRDFAKYYEPLSKLCEANEPIDWSKVNWVRNKLDPDDIYKLKKPSKDFQTYFDLVSVRTDKWQEIRLKGLESRLEPIKFTQMLKVGDIIKNYPRGIGKISTITPEYFEIDFFDSDVGMRSKHSDDWEFVNSSAGCIAPEKKLLLAPAFVKDKIDGEENEN